MANYRAHTQLKDTKYASRATEYFTRSWKEYNNPHALWNIALLEFFTGKYQLSIDHLDLYVESYKDSIEIDYQQVYSIYSGSTKALLEASK